MSMTARFALPLLHAGQAQKELSHNEALTLIDAIVHGCAEAAGVDLPPESPEIGECWIVGTEPEAEWVGAADALAVWTGGGWRFVAAREGMAIWVRSAGHFARYMPDGWIAGELTGNGLRIGGDMVVGARQSAIADPSGGAAPDAEARTAVAAILAALRAHGLIDTA